MGRFWELSSQDRDRQRALWINFAGSIALLAIAMVAALYSSGAARDGRVLPAGIAAVVALVIAVWVGLRFVPRLASSVDWDWLPFRTHYEITREGWIHFGAITIVVFAAINTSNNLLYMILSALLAVLALSGFLSALNFRYLKFRIRIPAQCFAAEPFALSIQVQNHKRVFPSFSLSVVPEAESVFRFGQFYVPVVLPRTQVPQSTQATIARRGRYQLGQVKVVSRYPFGFFAKTKMYPVDAECICYPEILPQEQMMFSLLDVHGWSQRWERGLGYDLHTIRNYVPSDSARHVHWKASAKTATLKTREYAAEESRRVVLLFDRYGLSADGEKFEKLVSHAGSLAFHLIRDGFEVALVSDEWQISYGSTQLMLDSILEYLALVEMSPNAERPSLDREDHGVMLSLRT
jgi:uncharacterized protein (DUF58 family)